MCYIFFLFFSPALVNSDDTTLHFLLQNTVDALLAAELSHKEYLLVFSSKYKPFALLIGYKWYLAYSLVYCSEYKPFALRVGPKWYPIYLLVS